MVWASVTQAADPGMLLRQRWHPFVLCASEGLIFGCGRGHSARTSFRALPFGFDWKEPFEYIYLRVFLIACIQTVMDIFRVLLAKAATSRRTVNGPQRMNVIIN
jgi:hypothetical protein